MHAATPMAFRHKMAADVLFWEFWEYSVDRVYAAVKHVAVCSKVDIVVTALLSA